jgi:hypothetical protein
MVAVLRNTIHHEALRTIMWHRGSRREDRVVVPVSVEADLEKGRRERDRSLRRLRLRLGESARAPVELTTDMELASGRVHVSPLEPERLALPEPEQHRECDEHTVLLRRRRDQLPHRLPIQARELGPLRLRPLVPFELAHRVSRHVTSPRGRPEQPPEHDQDTPDRPRGVRDLDRLSPLVLTPHVPLALQLADQRRDLIDRDRGELPVAQGWEEHVPVQVVPIGDKRPGPEPALLRPRVVVAGRRATGGDSASSARSTRPD